MALSLGSAFDPVQAAKVWEETLKREAACQKISEEFRINAKLLRKNQLTTKPTKQNPSTMMELIHSQDPNDDLGDDQELREAIAKGMQAPQEKFPWPMTSQMELGWQWKEGMEDHAASRKYLATHKQSEIVKYVESYAMAFGKSPYAK